MKKSKLVAVTEPPSQSKFFKRSAGAAASHHNAENMTDSATDCLNQLSVSRNQPTDQPHDHCPTESEAANSESAKSEAGKNEATKSEGAEEFRFNFSSSEEAHHWDSDRAAMTLSRKTASQNYFEFQPSSEQFRFNFAVQEDVSK